MEALDNEDSGHSKLRQYFLHRTSKAVQSQDVPTIFAHRLIDVAAWAKGPDSLNSQDGAPDPGCRDLALEKFPVGSSWLPFPVFFTSTEPSPIGLRPGRSLLSACEPPDFCTSDLSDLAGGSLHPGLQDYRLRPRLYNTLQFGEGCFPHELSPGGLLAFLSCVPHTF